MEDFYVTLGTDSTKLEIIVGSKGKRGSTQSVFLECKVTDFRRKKGTGHLYL